MDEIQFFNVPGYGDILAYVKTAEMLIGFLTDLFSGVPKLLKTEEAVARLRQSTLWQFQTLANNLQVWVRNGVPLSTSDPKLRAQLTGWIHGTIYDSGLGLRVTAQGYDEFSAIDTILWRVFASQYAYSGTALDQAVLNFQKVNYVLDHPKPPPPPPPKPPPPKPPPPPEPTPCDSGHPDQDEILDFCQATQTSLQQILAAIKALEQPGGGNGPDPCCTAVVNALGNITAQLANLTAFLVSGGLDGKPLDLTPLIAEIGNLVTAVNAYPPALQACCAALDKSLGNIAHAISTAPGTDVSGIVATLKQLADQGDVDQAIFQALQQQGTLSPADLQTLQGIKWSDALAYIESLRGVRTVEKFIKDVGTDADTVAGAIVGKLAKVGTWAENAAIGVFKFERNVIQDVLDPLLRLITSTLKPPGAKQIGNIGVNPDTVLSDVVAVGLNSFALTTLIGLQFPGAAEQLARITEIATGVLGFDELKEVQIGPLVSYGIARIAEMQAKALFGQELPGAGALAALQARGLITGQQYFTWVPYTGLPGELWEQTRESAYSGLGARRILPLINTGLFSNADIADELTFSGLRPASMRRYLTAAPYLSTDKYRTKAEAAVEAAHAAGLISDSDLTGLIDSLEQNYDRDSLILTGAHYKKLVTIAKDFEAEYSTMFIGGLIDDPTFRSYLDGIGLQADMVNAVAGKAEARANATLHRKELAAAAALARATAAEERKAAMKNFTTGNIDAAALAIALVATGLTATQAAAWVDLAVLQKSGNLRWKYGLQLSPSQATLLGQRVTALTDQRKRQLISDAQYVAGLQALGIPPNVINALQATADAMLSPKTSAYVVPVQT